MRSRAVPCGSTSTSARKLPEYTSAAPQASPASSVVAARRSARNGLCSLPEPPRSEPTDWRPGTSGRSTTDRSRAHVPDSWTSVHAASGQVQRGAHGGADRHGLGPAVRDPHRSRDDGQAGEDRGREGDGEAAWRVDEVDLERVGLGLVLDVRGRQPAPEGRLPAQDPVRGVLRVEDGRAVRRLHDEPRHPPVAHARPRQREPDRLAHAVVVAREREQQVTVRDVGCQRGTGVRVPDPAVLEDREHPAA